MIKQVQNNDKTTIKLIVTYLKSIQFTIVEADIDKRITAVNTNTNIVLTYLLNGYCVVCLEKESDVRFKGKIENLQQLKLILKLISTFIT